MDLVNQYAVARRPYGHHCIWQPAHSISLCPLPSSNCHWTPFLSTWWCYPPIPFSVFHSFSSFIQFLVRLFCQVLRILRPAHTASFSTSSLWSEHLHEIPQRLWLFRTPSFVMLSLCGMPLVDLLIDNWSTVRGYIISSDSRRILKKMRRREGEEMVERRKEGR